MFSGGQEIKSKVITDRTVTDEYYEVTSDV